MRVLVTGWDCIIEEGGFLGLDGKPWVIPQRGWLYSRTFYCYDWLYQYIISYIWPHLAVSLCLLIFQVISNLGAPAFQDWTSTGTASYCLQTVANPSQVSLEESFVVYNTFHLFQSQLIEKLGKLFLRKSKLFLEFFSLNKWEFHISEGWIIKQRQIM